MEGYKFPEEPLHALCTARINLSLTFMSVTIFFFKTKYSGPVCTPNDNVPNFLLNFSFQGFISPYFKLTELHNNQMSFSLK